MIGVEHCRKRAEAAEQSLGGRLGIAALPGGEQEVFENLVIGERFRPAFEQPPAQAGAVAAAAMIRAMHWFELIFRQIPRPP